MKRKQIWLNRENGEIINQIAGAQEEKVSGAPAFILYQIVPIWFLLDFSVFL